MAREICEILSTREDGEQEAACRFILENGKLTAEPIAEGAARRISRMLATPMWVNGQQKVTSKEQPGAWFHALPSNITGSYVRAKMVT